MKALNLQQLKNPDYIFPTFSFINISICLYLLYFWPTGDTNHSEQYIGKVRLKQNIVQQKYSDRSIWTTLENGAKVFNYDTLRTEKSSEAVIILSDGSRIEIGESSMVVLKISERETEIQLKRGNIQIRRTSKPQADTGKSKILIDTSKGKVALGPGAVDMSLSDKKGLRVTLKKGDAALEVDGKTEELKENEEILVDKDNKVARRLIEVKLLSPETGDRAYTIRSTAKLNFTWRVEGEKTAATTYRVEISSDRDFTRIARGVKTKRQNYQTALPPGNYYWRVQARASGEPPRYSGVGRFNVIRFAPPRLFAPQNKGVLGSEEKSTPVSFSWERDKNSVLQGGYLLEIASRPDFRDGEKLELGANTYTKDLLPGNYYWRVRIRETARRTGAPGEIVASSAILSFRVEQTERAAPPRPLFPGGGRVFYDGAPRDVGINFSWSGVRSIKSYELEIARSSDFKKILLKRKTGGKSLNLKENLDPGEYYWRLRGQSGSGRTTAYSQIARFRIKLPTPPRALGAGKILHELDAESGVELTWRGSGPRENYRLILKDSSNGKEILNRKTRNNHIKLDSLTSGRYYWKVALLDKNGKVVSESKPVSFSVSEKLKSPSLVFPPTGVKIDMDKEDRLILRWRRSKHARSYLVRLYNMKAKNIPVISVTTTRNYYEVKDMSKLDKGRFYWDVTALSRSKSGKKYQSTKIGGYFNLGLKKLKEPEIELPEEIYIQKEK